MRCKTKTHSLTASITLFSQIISKLDRFSFSKIVAKHQIDKHLKGYNCWTHLVSMLFYQFTKSQSARDISNGLRSATRKINCFELRRYQKITYYKIHKNILLVLVFGILIFDNLSWFSAQYYINTHRKFTVAIKITPTQKQLIKYIDSNYNHEYLLLSEFITIDYFATSYTDVHALIPHNYNTPFKNYKVNLWNRFFKEKDFSILPQHKILVVDNLISNGPMTELENNKKFKLVYKNKDYLLYERIKN